MNQEILRRRNTCRLCDSDHLVLAVPFEASPIADDYRPAERAKEAQATYPLDLYLCEDCGHLQNLDIVSPDCLFTEYTFRTGNFQNLVKHFTDYVEQLDQELALNEGDLVVEIGSNDGTLLRMFQGKGMRVVGIDPARVIVDEANASGIPTVLGYFGEQIAAQIAAQYGQAALVCANNVYGHADDLEAMTRGIAKLLRADGVFVFEVSYLPEIVRNFLFDTVYHEHVSYHSLGPLARFFERLGMMLFDAQPIVTKGGSIRGYAQLRGGARPITERLRKFLAEEHRDGYDNIALYRQWTAEIALRKRAVLTMLDELLGTGKTVAGYGASTTTTTLMWQFDLTSRLAWVLDDNPVKHYLYCPASQIQVLPSAELYTKGIDVVVVLAWQYARLILKRHRAFIDRGGIFVLPLREPRAIATIADYEAFLAEA